MKNLERLQAQLTNPLMNKDEVIKEIEALIVSSDSNKEIELVKGIKFQLSSPTFLREYCIEEVKTFIRKNNK